MEILNSDKNSVGGGGINARASTLHVFTGANKLNIPANSVVDYELRGTYNSTGHAVTVALGYKGTITLNSVNITTTDDSSCILFNGGTGNLQTATEVELNLIGTNNLWGAKNHVAACHADKYAAVHIKAGTRVTIDGSGSLDVKIYTGDTVNAGGQPAIGASFSINDWTGGSDNGKPVTEYAGGDLIVKGGKVTASGAGHTAGIGAGVCGGLRNIVILGGEVVSTGGAHGSGIGGGCYPVMVGSLVALPPTVINAKGGSGLDAVGGGRTVHGIAPEMKIFYLGDPDQKKLRVTAQELDGIKQTGRTNVNVLFDVSSDKTISDALKLANLNPERWYAGNTSEQGYWETTGKIDGIVKIYSDTLTPSNAYYSSKRVTIDGTKDVHIILNEPDLSIPYLQISKTPNSWTSGNVTLRASAEQTTPDVVRIRQRNGVWVNTTKYIDILVNENGIYYFEAEDSDGNTQTVSCVVDNIDKSGSQIKYNDEYG